jgi:hypothetical protein
MADRAIEKPTTMARPAESKRSTTSPAGSADEDMASRLTSLTMALSEPPGPMPKTATLTAHLRLLHAFDALKSSIGYRNGLWSINDSRAAGDGEDKLARVREKRWAVYLARAADRYAAWWESFVADRLLESDMLKGGPDSSEKYGNFLKGDGMGWTAEMLPPLGKVRPDFRLLGGAGQFLTMRYRCPLGFPYPSPQSSIFPRGRCQTFAFTFTRVSSAEQTQDCLRYGYRSLWAAGLPWSLINDTIDENFEYAVPEAAKSSWVERTGRAWLNEDDSDVKVVNCPACAERLVIPWTTCGEGGDGQGPT